MTDSKLTALTALTGANVATGDVLEVTDVSDTTMDASGTSKKITADELGDGLSRLRSTILATSYPTVSPGTVNSSAEADIANLTIPAAKLLAGDILVFRMAWDALNNTGGAVTFTYRFKLGATTVGTSGALSIGASAQRLYAHGQFFIALPALNTPRVWGGTWAGFAGTSFTGLNTGNSLVLAPQEPSVDLSSDTAVKLTCQMGTASANADFRLHHAHISRLR